jgi:membrane-bound ClpP family serine protease
VPSGSIFWGIVLIVLGVLLILANFEIILYETLFDFWPVAVIIIGLKLVADSVAKSKNGN